MALPPLNALRAFEAAGRHESFARAARELNVTQGAISRHVKLLEEHLGVELFRRHAQGLSLSHAGRRLLPEVSDSFEKLADAVRRTTLEGENIRVFCAPTLCMRWLVPRLGRFQERYPGYRIGLGLFQGGYEEFVRGDYDLAIEVTMYADVRPDDVEVLNFRPEYLTPVCAPALLETGAALVSPADVLAYPLIHPSRDKWDWRHWLASAGLPGVPVPDGHVFSTMEMAIQFAIRGHGIAVADVTLIRPELESGALVQPFEHVATEGTGYCLFARKGRFTEPKLAHFRDWLFEESAGDETAR